VLLKNLRIETHDPLIRRVCPCNWSPIFSSENYVHYLVLKDWLSKFLKIRNGAADRILLKLLITLAIQPTKSRKPSKLLFTYKFTHINKFKHIVSGPTWTVTKIICSAITSRFATAGKYPLHPFWHFSYCLPRQFFFCEIETAYQGGDSQLMRHGSKQS
jgi:hypothetical protein